MRKIIVFNHLPVDDVVWAPGRQDEDLRGGFQFGGWGAPYAAGSNVEKARSGPADFANAIRQKKADAYVHCLGDEGLARRCTS